MRQTDDNDAPAITTNGPYLVLINSGMISHSLRDHVNAISGFALRPKCLFLLRIVQRIRGLMHTCVPTDVDDICSYCVFDYCNNKNALK